MDWDKQLALSTMVIERNFYFISNTFFSAKYFLFCCNSFRNKIWSVKIVIYGSEHVNGIIK